MSKIDEVRKAMVEAMKSGNKERKESLSMLLSALKNKAIDKREDLTEAEENEVVLKEIKQTKETLEMTPQERTDLVNECKNRIAVYEEFAPKMLGEDEIVVLKEIKQTKETLEMTPQERTDLVNECKNRIAVYEEFAPKMLGEDEIKEVIQGVLGELGIDAPTGKDKGKIMKVLMPKVKGIADGKLVNQVLASMMQ